MAGSLAEELRARIEAKENELRRLTEDLEALRRSLAIIGGGRRAERQASGTTQYGQTNIDIILDLLQKEGKPLSGDEIFLRARANGYNGSRNTLLSAAYRYAKNKQKVKVVGRGYFALMADNPEGRQMALA